MKRIAITLAAVALLSAFQPAPAEAGPILNGIRAVARGVRGVGRLAFRGARRVGFRAVHPFGGVLRGGCSNGSGSP